MKYLGGGSTVKSLHLGDGGVQDSGPWRQVEPVCCNPESSDWVQNKIFQIRFQISSFLPSPKYVLSARWKENRRLRRARMRVPRCLQIQGPLASGAPRSSHSGGRAGRETPCGLAAKPGAPAARPPHSAGSRCCVFIPR